MEKYYDLKCLLKNTKDEKMKIFIYRNSYNELGLSTLCVEKDKEIERLKNIIKDAKIKLYELNYKLKEIHNIPFDISEIFEIIDLLDKVEK